MLKKVYTIKRYLNNKKKYLIHLKKSFYKHLPYPLIKTKAHTSYTSLKL